MGDIKRHRKKYSRPKVPWTKERIESEKELKKGYGLLRNIEIWKAESKLRGFKRQSKKLVALRTEQAEKEKKQLIEKLTRIGLLKKGDDLNKILELTVNDLLDRRLQTILFKKGLANTIKQARQMITHGHINVGDKKITSPSYTVLVGEETKINFNDSSKFKDEEHPIRAGQQMKEAPKREEKKEEKPTKAPAEETKKEEAVEKKEEKEIKEKKEEKKDEHKEEVKKEEEGIKDEE